jgi:hypothetical protein
VLCVSVLVAEMVLIPGIFLGNASFSNEIAPPFAFLSGNKEH